MIWEEESVVTVTFAGTVGGWVSAAGVFVITMSSHHAASSYDPMPMRPAPKVASVACMMVTPSNDTVIKEPMRATVIRW